MFKTKTLDCILYKERHYPSGVKIIVDDKDVNKLIKLGAIDGSGARDKKIKTATNIVKNPVKVKEVDPIEPIPEKFVDITEDKEIKKVELDPEVMEEIHEKTKDVKRKYNKRKDTSTDRSVYRGDENWK